MSPYLYPSLVHDRIDKATNRADARRLATQTSLGPVSGGLRSLRDVVGLGLIAIGERLVDHTETGDLRRAA